MKGNTSEWLGSLSQRALKDLVNLLFGIDPPYGQGYELFVELRRKVDDEYHSLKGSVRPV